MQKDENARIGPWLRYHGYLFGFPNLYVIDHGSKDDSVTETLSAYERIGVNVIKLDDTADYRLKGDYVSDVLQSIDRRGFHDILMPLDCDEFVIVKTGDKTYRCDKDSIYKELLAQARRRTNAQITMGLLNIPQKDFQFFPYHHVKIFFVRGHCGRLDHGSHEEVSGLVGDNTATNICHIHFHHRTPSNLAKAAREKLSPFVNVDDVQGLKAYTGPGFHLVRYLTEESENYLNVLNLIKDIVEVQGLETTFRQLGIEIKRLSQ